MKNIFLIAALLVFLSFLTSCKPNYRLTRNQEQTDSSYSDIKVVWLYDGANANVWLVNDSVLVFETTHGVTVIDNHYHKSE